MQAVWPDAFVTDDSWCSVPSSLRRALDDGSQQLLETVPRRGYRFTAVVIQHPTTPDHFPAIDPFELSDGREFSSEKIARKRRDLPVPRTSLIGREQQVTEATNLLLRQDVRLLSLTGPGVQEKTRLGIAVGAAIADRFTAGVNLSVWRRSSSPNWWQRLLGTRSESSKSPTAPSHSL